MSYQAIQLEIDQASNVATITLNRPDKLNSFTRAMHRELQSALDDVEAAGTRALILTVLGAACRWLSADLDSRRARPPISAR